MRSLSFEFIKSNTLGIADEVDGKLVIFIELILSRVLLLTINILTCLKPGLYDLRISAVGLIEHLDGSEVVISKIGSPVIGSSAHVEHKLASELLAADDGSSVRLKLVLFGLLAHFHAERIFTDFDIVHGLVSEEGSNGALVIPDQSEFSICLCLI